MATTTTNLALTKPDPADFYDITKFNENMDKIDEEVSKKAEGKHTHQADEIEGVLSISRGGTGKGDIEEIPNFLKLAYLGGMQGTEFEFNTSEADVNTLTNPGTYFIEYKSDSPVKNMPAQGEFTLFVLSDGMATLNARAQIAIQLGTTGLYIRAGSQSMVNVGTTTSPNFQMKDVWKDWVKVV